MTQTPSQKPGEPSAPTPAQASAPVPAADPASCGQTPPLRLLAVDAEDLDVLAAHLQDALVRVGDMAWLPGARRFALVGSRFDWCALEEGHKAERARVGLHFDYVTRVARTGVDQTAAEAVLNVLHIAFEQTDAPAGVVTIHFSGGGALRLEVECLEAHLRDLGERWAASAPAHPVEDAKD
ncbi:MAG: DUF2948 family protein [Beijerinckiaceae bacterium]|jgi:hypothetical protein